PGRRRRKRRRCVRAGRTSAIRDENSRVNRGPTFRAGRLTSAAASRKRDNRHNDGEGSRNQHNTNSEILHNRYLMTSLREVYCRVELSDAQRALTVRRPPAFFELCRSTGVFVREADDLKIAQRFIAGVRSGQYDVTSCTEV